MKQRKLVLGLLIMLAVAVSGFTFAYWASGVGGATSNIASNQLKIGTAGAVSTTLNVPTAQTNNVGMVPTTHKTGTEDTVEFTFSFTWTATGTNSADGVGKSSTLKLASYTFADIVNGTTVTGTELDVMFDVTAADVSITEGVAVDMVVTVVFALEPGTKVIYDAIAGQNLMLTLNFTVDEITF